MDTNQELLLKRSEVRLLVEASAVEPALHSPLAGLMQIPASGTTPALPDDSWKKILGILAAPAQEVRVIVPTPELSSVRLFYRSANFTDDFIGCWLEEDQLRLSRGWNAASILNTVASSLWSISPVEASPFTAELSPAALAAWAAAVDTLRALLFASLLKRATRIELDLTLEDIREQFQYGFECEDARWLVTLLRALAPAGFGLEGGSVEEGATSLEKAGLLTAGASGHWQPTPQLQQFAAHLKNPLPACSIISSFFGDKDCSSYNRYTSVVRGDGPLWVIDFAGLAESRPRAQLDSVTGADLLKRLGELLNQTPPPESLKASTAPAPNGRPSKPPTEKEISCRSCGALLSQGDAFCNLCGTAVAPQPSPSTPTCPECQAILRPGAAFCSSCGASLTGSEEVEPPPKSKKDRSHLFLGKAKEHKKAEKQKKVVANKASQPVKKEKGRKKLLLFMGFLVIVAVGLVLGADILELIEDLLGDLF